MSINEQRRAKFMVWHERVRKQYADAGMPQPYYEGVRERDWWLWNAAMDSAVVDLPVPVEPEQPDDAIDDSWLDGHNGAKRYRKTCVAAVEAAGIKVKS